MLETIMTSSSEQLLLLSDALSFLNGVKPTLARKLLVEWEACSHPTRYSEKTGFKMLPRKELIVGAVTLTPVELTEMVYEDVFQWRKLAISPLGARALLRLYEHDQLPLKPRTVKQAADTLLSYASRTESIQDIIESRAAHAKAVDDERIARLSKPLKDIPESELHLTFLHDLFLFHQITNGSLTLGEIEVTKTLSLSRSNSRKSHDWNECFTWVSSDGDPCVVKSQSIYNGNRSNDADRNWGLGRE